MREDASHSKVVFEPLRAASLSAVIAGIVLGPILWLVALVIASWIFEYSWAIGVGLLVTVASFVVSLIVLVLLRNGRRREERRYVDGR